MIAKGRLVVVSCDCYLRKLLTAGSSGSFILISIAALFLPPTLSIRKYHAVKVTTYFLDKIELAEIES